MGLEWNPVLNSLVWNIRNLLTPPLNVFPGPDGVRVDRDGFVR